MNDRTGTAMGAGASEMAVIERLVGALSGAVKGRAPAEMVAGLQSYAGAMGSPLPGWLTEAFVGALQERMRRMMGHWKAGPCGGSMELPWPL